MKRRRAASQVVRFAGLAILAAAFLAPLYWMISTSIKPESDTVVMPPQWIPTRPTLENYIEVLNSPDASILRWTFNSLFTSFAYTFFYLLLSIFTAYPLARLRFRGRDAWFWFLLSSMMIPGIMFLIPHYMMMMQFNWIDTYHALIWPGISGVFGTFMLRQFFLTIPHELEDAARIDGASRLGIIRHVILPLSVPAIVTLGVFSFMGSWNNYVWPLFVVHGDMLTLPVGVTQFSSRYITEYGKLMAGTAVASLPVLVVFVFAQRYFVEGLTLTGLKE
ncbi:MAG: carbohydrate ABC transporter permease [Firmicutes bacterium]|jgi:multiple sugar transport system permease protein|nr:carbohydrate ABC transporter permease [Bacillota bacterium]MDH7494699.1 carbohydrate ABC transporter permease [Bacillota bacterium]